MDNNTASLTVDNPNPLVARPAGGGFGCSVLGTTSGATGHGLWLIGIALGVLRLSRRRGSAVDGRLFG